MMRLNLSKFKIMLYFEEIRSSGNLGSIFIGIIIILVFYYFDKFSRKEN